MLYQFNSELSFRQAHLVGEVFIAYAMIRNVQTMLYNTHIFSALHTFLVCSAAIYPQNVFLRHLGTLRIEVKSFLGIKSQHISQDLQIVLITNIFGGFIFRIAYHAISAVSAKPAKSCQGLKA